MHGTYRKPSSYLLKNTCDCCENWKANKEQKEERRKTIEETLRSMEKSLREIKQILRNDEE